MARKHNDPEKMDTEKETGSKRRYQSPQTPPQAPRSAPRTQQGSTGRGMTEDDGQGRWAGQQDWQDDAEIDGSSDGRSWADRDRGSDFDLQKASRDELNAIAGELGIEDYETMNREELVMEIRERS